MTINAQTTNRYPNVSKPSIIKGSNCIIRGCKELGKNKIRIDLGERWDQFTLIAKAARYHAVLVCDKHKALVENFWGE